MQHYTKKTMDELERIDIKTALNAEKFPITILIDDVRSMNNVGSIFRTADAFNIEKIVLCGYTPQPPHRDIQKTALGATESVKWSYEKEIEKEIEKLKNQKYRIIAVEQAHNSCNIATIKYERQDKIAIIMGNEVNGVSDKALKLCDECVEIPQWGAKHSLNVAVATGVILWELVRNN